MDSFLSLVVQLLLCHLLPHCSPLSHPPTLTVNSPHCPCPWILYLYSLTCPFPFFPPFFPSSLPSGHCHFVLYCQVSGSILLVCLFCWLGWGDHTGPEVANCFRSGVHNTLIHVPLGTWPHSSIWAMSKGVKLLCIIPWVLLSVLVYPHLPWNQFLWQKGWGHLL